MKYKHPGIPCAGLGTTFQTIHSGIRFASGPVDTWVKKTLEKACP